MTEQLKTRKELLAENKELAASLAIVAQKILERHPTAHGKLNECFYCRGEATDKGTNHNDGCLWFESYTALQGGLK